MKTIKYKDFLKEIEKLFTTDEYKNKVLLVKHRSGLDTYQKNVYICNGIKVSDYVMYDQIVMIHSGGNKKLLNQEILKQKKGVCIIRVIPPMNFTPSGSIQCMPITWEKFNEEQFQWDYFTGRTLTEAKKNFEGDNIINSWVICEKLCYDIATKEDLDELNKIQKGFKLNIGDKMPPRDDINESFVDFDILKISEFKKLMEEPKAKFKEFYPNVE